MNLLCQVLGNRCCLDLRSRNSGKGEEIASREAVDWRDHWIPKSHIHTEGLKYTTRQLRLNCESIGFDPGDSQFLFLTFRHNIGKPVLFPCSQILPQPFSQFGLAEELLGKVTQIDSKVQVLRHASVPPQSQLQSKSSFEHPW